MTAPAGTIGTIYLIHFYRPIGNMTNRRAQAQHYLGWTSDLGGRLDAHRRGHGAAIMGALKTLGSHGTWCARGMARATTSARSRTGNNSPCSARSARTRKPRAKSKPLADSEAAIVVLVDMAEAERWPLRRLVRAIRQERKRVGVCRGTWRKAILATIGKLTNLVDTRQLKLFLEESGDAEVAMPGMQRDGEAGPGQGAGEACGAALQAGGERTDGGAG